MIMTTAQINQLVAAGASLVLDCSLLNIVQLKQITAAAAAANTRLSLKHVDDLTVEQLKTILAIAPGLIEIDLT